MTQEQIELITKARDFALACANDSSLYENDAFADIAADLSKVLGQELVELISGDKWGIK